MGTDRDRVQELNRITECIIGCAYRVGNTLGSGFLEKVYEISLAIEFRAAGLAFEQQKRIAVRYAGEPVGDYIADLVVEDAVLIEVKSIRALEDAHRAQCVNYQTATGLPLALLLNFKGRVEVKRIAGPSLAPYAAAIVTAEPIPHEHTEAFIQSPS